MTGVVGEREPEEEAHRPGLAGDRLRLLAGGGEEGGLLEEVARGIPGDGEFREHGEVDAEGDGAPVAGEHPVPVAAEVTHGGVDLAEGHAHGG